MLDLGRRGGLCCLRRRGGRGALVRVCLRCADDVHILVEFVVYCVFWGIDT